MRIPQHRKLVAFGALFAVIATAAPSQAAVITPDSVASEIGQVAPDQGAIVEPIVTQDSIGNDGQVRPAAARASVAINPDIDGDGVPDASGVTNVVAHLDPARPVSVHATGSEIPALSITTTSSDVVTRGAAASDGTVVYTGGRTSRAVQVLDDSSLRLISVAQSAAASKEVAYNFGDGIVPLQNDDGSVELIVEYPDEDGGESLALSIATLDAAWAYDNNGNAVPTHYEVEGDSVVQVIESTATSAYPVVSDPRVIYGGIFASVYFNKRETNRAKYGATAVATMAGQIPHPVVKAGVVVAAAAIAGTAWIAASEGKCVAVHVVAVGPVAGWSPWIHRGGFCR